MDSLRLLDLHFGGNERAIGVYLAETPDGLALLDCGPTSTLAASARRSALRSTSTTNGACWTSSRRATRG